MMKVSDFVRTVREMRTMQKVYFKNRLRGDLIKSKELEALVDKALEDGIVFDTLTTHPSAEEERQLRLHLEDERDAGEPDIDEIGEI